MRSLLTSLKVVNMLHPIVGNNDTEGTPASSLDKLGYDSAVAITQVGVTGDTLSGSVKYTLIAEDSDDNVTFAPVTEASYLQLGSGTAAPDSNGIVATIDDNAEDDVILSVGYLGPKRYFRTRLDFTGTHTNGTPISMVGLLGNAQFAPVSNT